MRFHVPNTEVNNPGLNTNTLQIAGIKVEKGSVATDWSANPADNATVTSVTNLSATVDGMKSDISKKIESKDLNGYATQTWAQNQIKTTADGISGTLLTVKNTVDGYNTTINDLQADSDGFKSQFTTVNDTLGKQTTDIGTLQASSKELTSGFNTLTSDNTTNKNDISQLKQTSTELSSTMTTVQTQVQNSAVGTNLVTGTSEDTVIDDTANTGTQGWCYYTFNLTQQLKVGNQITVSAEGMLTGRGDLSAYDAILFDSHITYARSNSQRLTAGTRSSVTLEVNNLNGTGDTVLLIYAGNSGDTEGKKNVIHHLKVEEGSLATDWCLNPADTATVTALSKLSQTVDGLTGTFATKNDLATTTTQLKLTSDGLNLITAVTGTNGENVTQVITDVNNIKTTMTGANGVTTRLQTLEGFQSTATSNITNLQTQQTTLAGQYTSLIESADNKVLTPWFDDSQTGTWNNPSTQIVGGPDSNVQGITGHSKYLKLFGRDNYEGGVGWFSVTPGEVYYFSGYMGNWGTTYAVGVGLNFVTEDGTLSWVKATGFPANSKTPMSAITGSITVPAGVVRAQTWVQIDGPAGTDLGYAAISGLRISKSASNSQITQLQGLIDQRVMVDGKIAAALSLSADGGGTVTIRGASLFVTASSHFDDASIQSAAIANLDAEKITSGSIAADRLATTKLNADNITSGSIAAARIATTALSATNIISGTLDVGKLTVKNLSADMIASGTIDASKITVKNLSASNIIGGELDAGLVNVKNINASNIITGTLNAGLLNVIGLNASAIATGTITGANLAINLNSGQVVFQSGQIHSSTNNIDINIDKGYMSVADSTSRVLLKGGQLQFVQPQLFDLQTTPYLSISNDGVGSNWAGATIVGRDSIMLANSANVGDILTWQLGQNTFSGLISGKNSNGNWEPTILGGAERGVVIVGGTVTSDIVASSPYIRVGSSPDGQSAGSRIYVKAQYFYVPSTYNHTYSGSANVIVAPDGALLRTASATKYKSNIERFRNTDMGEALLNLPQAHWYNKGDMQRYADEPQYYSMPKLDYGMIAEDLAAAGLEDLVVRGDDGQLEDIRYDRFGPALLPLLAKMKQEIEELKSAAKSA